MLSKRLLVILFLCLGLSIFAWADGRVGIVGNLVEHLSLAPDAVDSTNVMPAGLSSTDLPDTLRVRAIVAEDTLTFRVGTNYLKMYGGFILGYGRFTTICTTNYGSEWRLEGTGGTGRGTGLGFIGSGREATGSADDSTAFGIGATNDMVLTTKDENVTNVKLDSLGVTHIFGSLGLEKRTSMPDTGSWSGGNMWLSEIGDSLYTYLTDYTIVVTSSGGAGLVALQTWAEDDSAHYDTAYINSVGTHTHTEHIPIAGIAPSPANAPTADTYGITFAYECAVNTDAAYLKYYVPHEYAGGDISVYIGWTRRDEDVGVDESGETVNWQLKNLSVNSTSENVNSGENTDTIQDVYDSAVVASQVGYKTAALTIAAGEIAIDDVITMEIMAVTVDSGTPLTSPALLKVFIDVLVYNTHP